MCCHRCRQRARRWRKRAVEAHFAEAHDAIKRIVRQGADGGHHGERNRQIVMGPLFRHVGRRQIDDETASGNRQADRGKGSAHALSRFRDRLVAKPNDDDAVGAAVSCTCTSMRRASRPEKATVVAIAHVCMRARLYPQTGPRIVHMRNKPATENERLRVVFVF